MILDAQVIDRSQSINVTEKFSIWIEQKHRSTTIGLIIRTGAIKRCTLYRLYLNTLLEQYMYLDQIQITFIENTKADPVAGFKILCLLFQAELHLQNLHLCKHHHKNLIVATGFEILFRYSVSHTVLYFTKELDLNDYRGQNLTHRTLSRRHSRLKTGY